MNQTLSAAVHSLTPPILWNAYLRMRGFRQRFPWQQFGFMGTCANAEPLFEGKFAEIYDKYRSLDPFVARDATRYLNYNNCFFANLCRNVPGDFVCAGVSWGVAPRVIFDCIDFTKLGKTFHLVDPFQGAMSSASKRVSQNYNCDPDYVLQQYPLGAPVVIHRQPIPIKLPGKLAFVFSNTGDPSADVESIPIFFEALSPGGIIITNQYANYFSYYEPVLSRLGVAALWLPSGQGVIIKA
jgi:hypothetical protein